MNNFLKFSFQHKILLILVLLLNIPFFLTGYIAQNIAKENILRENGKKLTALAEILDARLDADGFDGILLRQGALDASREEKIRLLNAELSGITEEVGNAAPGLGVGYYSLELEAILTYGPAAQFQNNVGLAVPPDHPGRIVMRTGQPQVQSGHMVRGNIMNAMVPIKRGGKVIGYIWANELTEDILAQFNAMTRSIVLFMALCCLLTVCTLLILSRRTLRDVSRIMKGLRAMRSDLSSRIEETGGDLGEVTRSINDMAAEIGKANAETARAVAVLQRVLSNVEACVYVCDPASKMLVYTNNHMRKLVGAEADLQGQVCYQAFYGLDKPCSFCQQPNLFEPDGKPIFTPIRWERHSNFFKRDFLITDRLITWHDGRLLHMQVGTDVTERNALAVAEAANQAQRDFLARMSHEIRTPMNGVLGMTRLAMQADPPPAQLEYLKKIQSSATILLGIINDILDFSRIEAGKLNIEKHVFNLHELVENIRELVLPQVAGKQLELVVNVDASVPQFAVGDGLRLSQVLLNLMGNASKFTLEGSITLSLRAENVPGGNLLLYCSVRDSGIGMNTTQLAALFRPFSQADASTSRKFGGTGLGLSISKALVEAMGGVIGVNSEEGQGSEFYFHVLLEASDATSSALKPEVQDKLWEQARYDGRKFLLVEDNVINQEVALAILEELGASVDVANNGSEGLNAFLEKDYDLILMDVRMPVMDGLEATRAIRISDKHDAALVPIIAMTANAMREDREASRLAGMDGHIAKPIDLHELKSVLYQQIYR